jgi:hypothetical protein
MAVSATSVAGLKVERKIKKKSDSAGRRWLRDIWSDPYMIVVKPDKVQIIKLR